MTLEENIEFVGRALDDFYALHPQFGVAGDKISSKGVPPEMWKGEVDEDGWVEWNISPSKLTLDEVKAIESQYGVAFPNLFRAYLLARHHLFDQIHSRKHTQLILMCDTPSGDPLGPLRREVETWKYLIKAQYFPFAEWGDGWGPMCFDLTHPDNGDYPIIWMDHELLARLSDDEQANRGNLEPLSKPLYESFSDFFSDTFDSPVTNP